MEVKINEDKISATCLETGKQYKIKFLSGDGSKDLTSLASVASKSYWFDKDNPEYEPDSIQEGSIVDGNYIIIKQ